YRGDEFEMPPPSNPPDAALAARAVGTYQLEGGGRLVIRSERGKLQIGALGQDATDELTCANEAERRQRAVLGHRAKAVVDGISQGDTKPLAQWLRPGGPLQAYVSSLGEELADAAKKNGALQSVEEIGTVPGAYPVGILRSILRLNGQTGSEQFQ